MNILASYNWIKEFLKTDLSPEEFALEFSRRSMSVESTTNLAEKFEHMVVGIIKEMKPHPKADRLQICITDIGTEVVEIVCGGSNVAVGMKVFVALPGSRVRWHGEGDLIELKETEIRGVKSIGMICAPAEVGFEKLDFGDHGIWDLSGWTEAKAGTPIAEALELNDTIFDMEITTNRPDCMSMIGLACEGGAATEGAFHLEPRPEIPAPKQPIDLKVTVKDADLCPRYMAVAISGVKVGPSPAWLQTKLLLAGHRPINNIVDITNYVLHEYGQPLHAFDYDKLEGKEIVVRRAASGEDMLALDGKRYDLAHANLVIADAKKPVAIAGVMGAEESGTHEGTTTIVFESAAFEPVSIRRTSRALNLQSDAQLLFEKGLSTESPTWALRRAVELALEIAGGEVATEVFDVRAEPYEPKVFTLRPDRVRRQIGVEIPDDEQRAILKRLGFMIDGDQVAVPFWRDHDIEAEVDLTEEIARMYGYHNLPNRLPASPPPSTPEDPALAWEDWIKQFLFSAGYTELYGYSFTCIDELSRYGIDPKMTLAIYNPLSADLTHLRTSLMPSLLRDIESNQGERKTGKVFELARVYLPQGNALPEERTRLVVAEYGLVNVEEAFLRAKGLLTAMLARVGLAVTLQRKSDDAHWHATRSADILWNGNVVGTIGVVSDATQKAFAVDAPILVIDLDIETVIPVFKVVRRYEPIPAFPSVTRDLSFAVDERVEYQRLATFVGNASPLIVAVDLKDIYRGMGVAEGKKSITLTLVLRAQDRTLTSDEVDVVVKTVAEVLEKEWQATLR